MLIRPAAGYDQTSVEVSALQEAPAVEAKRIRGLFARLSRGGQIGRRLWGKGS